MTATGWPTVEGLDGWVETDRQEEELFRLGRITVTARTVVHEDPDLRARIAEAVGVEGTWRFFFASRLVVSPTSGVSRALRRYVTSRAKDGFEDRLRDRGFEGIEAAGSRSLAVGVGTEASAFRYRAVCPLPAVTPSVEGWLAVWPDDGAFLMAGGAYPTGIESASDDTTAESFRDCLDPEGFRSDLVALIRSTT